MQKPRIEKNAINALQKKMFIPTKTKRGLKNKMFITKISIVNTICYQKKVVINHKKRSGSRTCAHTARSSSHEQHDDDDGWWAEPTQDEPVQYRGDKKNPGQGTKKARQEKTSHDKNR
jgi:hypothetical protein